MACVGFGCLARSPGDRKSSFFLWLFGTFFATASPICVLQSLLSLSAARHFFRTEQFGGIHPHFFPSITQLSSKPSSSETSFQKSFWDSVVDRPYYRPSPLLSFHKHAEGKSWILTWRVWKFGRMFVLVNPHCRHKAVNHRRSAALARGKMKMLSPIYPPSSGRRRLETCEKGTLRSRHKRKKKDNTTLTAFRSLWEMCHLIQLAVHDRAQMFTANMQIHRSTPPPRNETSHHETQQGLPGGPPRG